MSALVIAIVGLFCFLAGLGIAFWYIKTDSSINATKVQETKTAFDNYKADVNAHFTQTAHHFQAIGEQYKALYEHMAEGAESLLGLEGEEAQRRFPLIAPAAAAAQATAEVAAEDAGEVIEGIAETAEAGDPELAAEASDEALAQDENIEATADAQAPADDEASADDEAPAVVEAQADTDIATDDVEETVVESAAPDADSEIAAEATADEDSDDSDDSDDFRRVQ